MRFLQPTVHAVQVWHFRRKINRYDLIQRDVATDLSLEDVELFFQAGVSAPDAPIFLSGGQALAVVVSAYLGAGLVLYLMVHLSAPLW